MNYRNPRYRNAGYDSKIVAVIVFVKSLWQRVFKMLCVFSLLHMYLGGCCLFTQMGWFYLPNSVVKCCQIR
jgi:hypothetical protein